MLMKDGMRSKYCPKEVNMCQGSIYIKDARKYNPNVAANAMMIIPGPDEPKKVCKNLPVPSLMSMSVPPWVKARYTRYMDRMIM